MESLKCTPQNLSPKLDEFLGFASKNNINSQKLITNLAKSSFLFGADMALMSQRSPGKLIQFDSDPSQECGAEATSQGKIVQKKVTAKPPKYPMLHSSSPSSRESRADCIDYYVDVSSVVDSPSGGCNEFPLNILVHLAIMVLKLFGFQMNLFVWFFTLPIWVTYYSLMFILFPFQTLSKIRHHLRKKLLGMWVGVCSSLTSFISERIKRQKSLLKMGVRLGWAFLSAVYVFLILVGMLLSGFLIGGFTLKRLVDKPIQATETLNFDYTKASPVALVPFSSSTSLGTNAENAIPINHKLLLTVSLTMPESDYNRKLGVFQVRVDFLSASGKTTASMRYPCMLRFKSQPVRVVETVFKSVPLIAGIQSEDQTLNVKVDDFTEGEDPTASLRVILEQRAEYQSGAGIPEVYAASVDIRSELPRIKRVLWAWRRTVFVWSSLMSFLMQVVVVLIFCRAILHPKGRLTVTREKKQNKISWY